MFEGDSAGMCDGKFPLMTMGGRAEGLACADQGVRTPIGVSGNLNCSSTSVCTFVNASVYNVPVQVSVTNCLQNKSSNLYRIYSLYKIIVKT